VLKRLRSRLHRKSRVLTAQEKSRAKEAEKQAAQEKLRATEVENKLAEQAQLAALYLAKLREAGIEIDGLS